MKKLIATSILASCIASSGFAQDITNPYQQNTASNTSTLVTYLQNLGAFLGYDLTTKSPPAPVSTFSSPGIAGYSILAAFWYYLGAIPQNNYQQTNKVVPDSFDKVLNVPSPYTNFDKPSTGSSSNSKSTISVSQELDQMATGGYQKDPTSQLIQNFLTTPTCPDPSSLSTSQLKSMLSDTNNICSTVIAANLAGTLTKGSSLLASSSGTITLPSALQPNNLTNSTNLQGLIPQLNANSLIGPMMYDTSSNNNNSNNTASGLTADNQAQVALNFIRWVTNQASPPAIDMTTYQSIAGNLSKSSSKSLPALQTISNYLNQLRGYAAASSVGASNLNFLMAKRIPNDSASQFVSTALQSLIGQNQSQSTGSQMAQQKVSTEFAEFQMASRRLFPISSTTTGSTTPWLEQINTASSAQVQKEIALLLAEMNYQLYLNRQIQERMLMTNSILLLQSMQMSKSTITLSSDSSSSSSGS